MTDALQKARFRCAERAERTMRDLTREGIEHGHGAGARGASRASLHPCMCGVLVFRELERTACNCASHITFSHTMLTSSRSPPELES